MSEILAKPRRPRALPSGPAAREPPDPFASSPVAPYAQPQVPVNNAAAVHTQKYAPIDSRIGLDQRRTAVLMGVVIDAEPRCAIVVGAVDCHGGRRCCVAVQVDCLWRVETGGGADGHGIRPRYVCQLAPRGAPVHGMKESIAAERQPHVTRMSKIDHGDAAAGAVATPAPWQRRCIYFRKGPRT